MKGKGAKVSRVSPYIYDYTDELYDYINKVVVYIPGEDANIANKDIFIDQVVKNLARRDERYNIKFEHNTRDNIRILLDHNNINNPQKYKNFIGSINSILLYQPETVFNIPGHSISTSVDVDKTIKKVGKQARKYPLSETQMASIDPNEQITNIRTINVMPRSEAGPSGLTYREKENTRTIDTEENEYIPNRNLNRRRSTLSGPNPELESKSGLTNEEIRRARESMGEVGEGRGKKIRKTRKKNNKK